VKFFVVIVVLIACAGGSIKLAVGLYQEAAAYYGLALTLNMLMDWLDRYNSKPD
jgi:hypothetical protein